MYSEDLNDSHLNYGVELPIIHIMAIIFIRNSKLNDGLNHRPFCLWGAFETQLNNVEVTRLNILSELILVWLVHCKFVLPFIFFSSKKLFRCLFNVNK